MKNFLFLLPVLITGGLAALVRAIFQSVPRGHLATKTRNGEPVKYKKSRLDRRRLRWTLSVLRFLRFRKYDAARIGCEKIYRPGKPVFKIPFVEEVIIRRVNGQNINLQQEVRTKEGLVYELETFIHFYTADVVRYTYENERPRVALSNKARGLMRKAVVEMLYNPECTVDEIAEGVKNELTEHAESWGIYIHDFGVTKCDPTPATERMIQMRQQSQMALDALEEASDRLGFENAREMGPAWAGVLMGGSTVNAIPAAAEIQELAEKLDEELEFDDSVSSMGESNGNSKLAILRP